MKFVKIDRGDNGIIYVDLDEVLYFDESNASLLMKNGLKIDTYCIRKDDPSFVMLHNYFENKCKL